ncbi:MAG: PKD domain-containing protein [Bacteroidales bacterium]
MIGNKLIPEDLSTGDYVVKYTYTDSNACSNTDTADVTIKKVPDVAISGLDSAYCNSTGEVTITGNPLNGTYTDPWGDPDIFEDQGDGDAVFDPSDVPVEGKYTIGYKATGSNGCTDSTRQKVKVNFVPSVSFTGLPDSICENADSVTLTGSPADSGGVYNGPGINDHEDGTAVFDPSGLSAGHHDIIYEYTDSVTGCVNSDTQSVKVLDAPNQFTLSGGGFYCEGTLGNKLELSGSEAGTQYQLIRNQTTLMEDTMRTSSGNFDFDGYYKEGEYSVYAIAPNGCADSMQNTQTITLKELPDDAQPISGDDTVAVGDTGSYTVPPIANTNTYNWLLPSGASVVSGSGTSSIDVSFSSTPTGYDSVAVYGSNSCGEGDTAYFKVYIQHLPDTAGPISGSTSLCEGDQGVTYSIPSLSHAEYYEWTMPSGFNIVNGDSTTNIEVDIDSTTVNGYVIVRGVNASGAGEPDSLYVNVHAIPDISITKTRDLDCKTDSVLLSGSSFPEGDSYTWTGGGRTVTNDSIYAKQSGEYTLTVSASGCSNSRKTTVEKNTTPPDLTVTEPDTLTCDNPSINLEAVTSADTVVWTASSGGHIVSGDSTRQPEVNAEGNYTVKVIDANNGCYTDTSVWVETDSSTYDFSLSVSNDLTCSVDSAIVSTPSIPGASYSWDGPNITDGWGTSSVTVNDTGTYKLTVTKNATGCGITKSAEVDSNTTKPGNVTLDKSGNIDCDHPQVTLTADADPSGTSFEIYKVSSGSVIATGNTATVNSQGQYAVTAFHPLTGCTAEDTIYVDDNTTSFNVNLSVAFDTIICNEPYDTLRVTSPSNLTDKTVLWSTSGGGNIVEGIDSSVAIVSAAGDYTATVEDTTTGCTSSEQVNVNSDFNPPSISGFTKTPDSLTCAKDVNIEAEVTNYQFLSWSGPGNITIPREDSVFVDQPGIYTMVAEGSNGCKDSSDVIVPADTASPNMALTTNYDDITCKNTEETLHVSSGTPNVTYQWSVVSGSGSLDNPTSQNPVVDGPGTFKILVTDEDNKCTSEGQVTVGSDSTKPTITGFDSNPDSISCRNEWVELQVDPFSNADLLWTTTGIGNIRDATTTTPEVDAAGTYILTATHNVTGCTAKDTVEVYNNFVTPTADAQILSSPGQITCTNDTVRLDGSGSSASNYFWFTPDGHILSPNDVEQPYVGSDGDYFLAVEHPFSGCKDTASVEVTKNNAVPGITKGSVSQDTLNCRVDSSMLEIDYVESPAEYWWSTSDGNIRSGDSSLVAVVDAPGKYVFTARNTNTGCTNSKQFLIHQNIDKPKFSLFSDMLTCSRDTVQLSTEGIDATDDDKVSYSWEAGSGGLIVGDTSIPNPKVTQPADYHLTLIDDVNGCTRTKTVTVSENTAKPNVSVDSAKDLTCARTEVTLSATTDISDSSFAWSTKGSGHIAANRYTPTPTVDAPGWYIVKVTNNNTGCYTKDSVYVNEDVSEPDVFVDPIQDITCSREWVELSGSSSDDVYYQWSGGTGTITDPNSALTEVNASGDYILTVEDKVNGCTNDTTVTVYEDTDAPSAPMVSDTGNCYGSSNVPINASGSNITWYKDTPLNSANQVATGSSYTPSVSAVGNYTYYVTQTGSNGCESNPAQMVYTVYALPSPPTANDQESCFGEPVPELQATPDDPANPVNWYDASDNFLSTSEEYQPNKTAAGTYYYGVTQVGQHGCESNQESVSLTIHDLPSAPVVDEDTLRVCEGSPNKSFFAEGTNIAWYNTTPPASPIATGNMFTPTVSGTGTYTFYVTQSSTSTSCESPYTEVTYIILPNPDAYNVTGGGTYCEGTGGKEISLDNSDASTTYELRQDGNTYITGKSGTGGSLSFGQIKPEGTYTVYGTASNGCVAKMSGTAIITVDSLPEAAGDITGEGVVCQGATGIDYSVPEIEYADDYIWSIPDGAEIVAGNNSNAITVNYSDTAQSGIVTVYGSNSCGDGAVSTGFAVEVNPLPDDAGSITGPSSICQGADGVSFEVPKIDHADTYVWSVPSGATIVSGNGTRSILVNFNESSTGGIVKVYGKNGCGTGATSPGHSVDVNSKPIIDTETYQSICSASDSLIADDPGSASINWDLIDGQATIANPNSFETEVTDLGNGINNFEVTLTSTSNGCADIDTVTIENNQQFVNAGADQTLCADSFKLSGSEPDAGVTGTWSVEQGSATFADANQYNTMVKDLAKGVNVLRWTLTKNGCTSYDEVTIINDSPTTSEAGIAQDVCADSTWLDANTPSVGGGEWSIVQGFVDFQDKTDPDTKITSIARGENILRWTITNNACSSQDTVRISNNQVDVEAGNDQVLCTYRTNLDATPPAKGDGEWSVVKGSATFDDRFSPTTEVYLGLSDTTVLAWNVYYEGCQSADSITLINNSPSNADAGENKDIYQNSVYLDATIPTTGTGKWSLLEGAGNIQDVYDPKTEVTELAYGENLFQWKVTHEGCVSIDSVTINNKTTGSVSAGNDTIICNDEIRLNGSEPLQGEGEWSVVTGSATFDDKSAHNTMARNLARGENVLKWTVYGNGVVSDTVKITNNSPTEANAGPDMAYCRDSVQLSANNPTVGTGEWTLVAGDGTFGDKSVNNTTIEGLGTGKNTLRWTITHKNCKSSDEVIITNNEPTQADAGVDQTLCSDEATLYGNSPSVGEGLWTLVSGSNSVEFQDQTVGNTRVTNLGHGDNVLRWTITNENCSSSDEVTITNDNPTEPIAGRDKSICVDSFRMNANEAVIGDGEWSVISGYGDFNDPSDHETKVKNLAKGNNILRWTIEHNGCVLYDEVEISNDLIEADAGYDQELCQDSTDLSANNPGQGEGYWSVVTGSAVFEDASNPNTSVSELDHRNSNVLKWTISHKSCVSTDKVTIENKDPGIVYAGQDNEVCDDSYYLKANPNYIGDGHWEALSGGGNIQDDSSATTSVTDMGLGENTFRWRVNRDGCVKYDDVTIYNNLPVEAYAGENDSICTTSYTMHAEEPPFGVGRWTVVTGSGDFEEATRSNTQVSNLSQGVNTFKWTVYNGSCFTSDEVTIVVNRPNTPRAGADQEICGDSTTMQGNKVGPGQTGTWEVVEGSGEFEDPHDPKTKVTNMSHGSNTYRWNISYRGCNLYDEVTIVNNSPTEANAGNNIHVCGDEVRLNANEPSIGTGEWSLVSGDADFSDKTNAKSRVTNLGFGPNTLRWTTTNGNCTTLDEVIVYNDKAQVYAGVDQEVYRDSTTLVANKPTRGEGKWIILGGSGTFDDPTKAQSRVRDLSGGVNTFRWTITNNGCKVSDEVSITYYVMPEPEIDVNKDNGCPPLSVQFYNESIKRNSDFTWDFDDDNISTHENPRHTFYEPGEYTVKLKTKAPDGSTVTEDTTIVVHDVPEARFDVAPEHLYIPEQHLQCYDMSIDADRYLWHFGDGATSDEPSPKHMYQDTGNYNIRLEVWSPNECYDDTIITNAVDVDQSGKIKFPSGFTPNSDGPVGGHYNENSRENNVFHPIAKGVEEYHLQIFNRWGVMVFESDKLDVGWDGYYQDKLAQEGVYIYKVQGRFNNGNRFEKVGDFVLIRK